MGNGDEPSGRSASYKNESFSLQDLKIFERFVFRAESLVFHLATFGRAG